VNRRGFFKSLLGAAVGIACGEELAELLEPRKLIMLPPAGGWPASAFTWTDYYGEDLATIVRRAFVPKMVIQLYESSPLIADLLKNSQPSFGKTWEQNGLNRILLSE
jgi:hypothetical protein